MRIVYNVICLLVLFSVGFTAGCAGVKVSRTDVNRTVDLSGQWNDSDSRMVAEEMIKDCLQRPWLNQFNIEKGKVPAVIVGSVINRTAEHINPQIFISELEKNFLNSGKVKFVSDRQQRQELREEKADQAEHSTKQTAKTQNAETGADFMLQGSMNSLKDEIDRKYVILYQVNLELVDLTTHEKVWIGQKEIKKIVSRRAFGL